MKIIVIILTIIQISSCGKLEDLFNKEGKSPYNGMGYDERLLPYIDFFNDISGIYPNYPIVIESMKKLGVCITYSNGDRVIKINTSEVPKNGEYSIRLEYIMLHEIGHCTFNRGHINDKIQTLNGILYKSIMNQYLMNITLYIENKEYYLNEYFNKNKVTLSDYFILE